MDDQVKTAIESLGKTFEAFKETHQEELKQIKKKLLFYRESLGLFTVMQLFGK